MEIKKGIKKDWLILLLIILISLSLQALIAVKNKVPDYDEAIHFDLAKNITKTHLPIISDGKGTVFFNHPALSFYLMAIPLFFSPSLFWGRALGSILSILIILGTYLIGRKLGGSTVGFAAAFLLAIHPHFLTFAHSLYIEIYLGFFIIVSVVFFLLAKEKRKSVFYLLSGIALGLAFLTKYLAVVLFFSYLAFFLFKRGRKVFCEKKLYLVLIPAGAIFLLWPIFGYMVDWSGFLDSVNLWLTFGKENLHDPRVNVGLAKHILALFLALSPLFALASFLAFTFLSLKHFKEKNLIDCQGFLLIFITFWFVTLFLMSIKDIKYLFPILPFLSVVLASSISVFHLTIKELILALVFLIFFSPLDFLNLRKTPLNNRLYFSLYMWRIEPDNESCFRLGEYIRKVSKEDEIILYNFNDAVGGFCTQRPYRTFLARQDEETIKTLGEANFVIIRSELFQPYLSEEEKQQFLARLESEFFLAKTLPGWGRVFIRKGYRYRY